MEYIIEAETKASREEAWKFLTDFPSYPEWNSVLEMRKNDNLEVGKFFHVTIHHNGEISKFRAMTLYVKDNDSFAAEQRILGKWFFSAIHHFIITEKNNRIVLVQRWELKGIIARLFRKRIFKLLDEFKKMNREFVAELDEQHRMVQMAEVIV